MNANIVNIVLNSGLLNSDDSSAIIYDLDLLQNKLNDLKSAFPENWLHAMSIKACPLPKMMNIISLNKLGAEAASLEEVYLALDSQFKPETIVYDGPGKTKNEIHHALKNNILINADSFEELDLIAELAVDYPLCRVGLRLNPATGYGKIEYTSVVTRESHFGVLIEGNENRILEYFKKYHWLCGIHVHSGSQGMHIEQLVHSIQTCFNFSKLIPNLRYFDIGGGLPARYKESDPEYGFKDYAKILKCSIPDLFNSPYQFITEFGRSLFANTALAISHIEYVKNNNQIISQLGADFLLRKIYQPQLWSHRLGIVDQQGNNKATKIQEYKVVGPLCFAGDVLEKSIQLPHVEKNDYLVIYDVGAYTLSMWSRHCNRATPRVFGIQSGQILELKNRETRQQIYNFWT